jgi:hypothetical protein
VVPIQFFCKPLFNEKKIDGPLHQANVKNDF